MLKPEPGGGSRDCRAENEVVTHILVREVNAMLERNFHGREKSRLRRK
jgi:hypothetical protein